MTDVNVGCRGRVADSPGTSAGGRLSSQRGAEEALGSAREREKEADRQTDRQRRRWGRGERGGEATS